MTLESLKETEWDGKLPAREYFLNWEKTKAFFVARIKELRKEIITTNNNVSRSYNPMPDIWKLEGTIDWLMANVPITEEDLK